LLSDTFLDTRCNLRFQVEDFYLYKETTPGVQRSVASHLAHCCNAVRNSNTSFSDLPGYSQKIETKACSIQPTLPYQ
jgi:hypothetical protein